MIYSADECANESALHQNGLGHDVTFLCNSVIFIVKVFNVAMDN